METWEIWFSIVLSMSSWMMLKRYLDKYHASAEGLMNDLLGKMDWAIIILSMFRIFFMLSTGVFVLVGALRFIGLA